MSLWLTASIAIVIVGGAISAALLSMNLVIGLLSVYVSAGIAAFIAWRNIVWRNREERFFSVGAVALLMTIVNRVIYAADVLLAGPRLDAWPLPDNRPEWFIFAGEAVTILGTLLTVAVWLRVTRFLNSDSSSQTANENTLEGIKRYISWAAIYMVSLSVYLLASLSKELAQAVGQLTTATHLLGLFASFMVSTSVFHLPATRVVAALILCGPFIYGALGSGMKEDVIISFLPVVIVVLMMTRSIISKGFIGLAVIGAFGLLTNYVQFYRDTVWIRGEALSTSYAVTEFLSGTENAGEASAVTSGVATFLARANSSYHRGITISAAGHFGYKPGLVFAPLAYVFIPRILWPEKPDIKQGQDYSALLWGEDYLAWSTSSTSAGLYPSFYLGWGPAAVLLGSAVLGAVWALAIFAGQRAVGRYFELVFWITMLPYAIRLDEAWSVGAISAPIITSIYLILIIWSIGTIVRAVSPVRDALR